MLECDIVSVAFGLLLPSLVSLANAHPQCLDFLPPFEGASGYCTASSEQEKDKKVWQCCTRSDHASVKDSVAAAVKGSSNEAGACAAMHRTVLCGQCHPYAAHIYDAESEDGYSRPGLTSDYCKKYYVACKDHLTVESGKLLKDHRSESEWCKAHTIEDSGYALPDVSAVDDEDKQEQLGQLCGEQLVPELDLANPIAAVNDGTSSLLYVVQQRGLITAIDLSEDGEEPLLWMNVNSNIFLQQRQGDERGLLAIQFHPDFEDNNRFFLYYYTRKCTTGGSGSGCQFITRLSEFSTKMNDDGVAVGDIGSERVLMEILQPEGNHNGGDLLFDETGKLLIFTGDGGGAGDKHGSRGNGQNPGNLLGKVLRIDVSSNGAGSSAYTVPSDNPFLKNSNFKDEIYAWGLRNPWRCSVDRKHKDRIFCGDVGQNAYEEIDLIQKGLNYGWRGWEGFKCYDSKLCNSYSKEATHPIHAYPHVDGRSVTGGYVYRGCLFPNLVGRYIFGDFVTGRVWALELQADAGDNDAGDADDYANLGDKEWKRIDLGWGNSGKCTGKLTGEIPEKILSFGEDAQGELYILTSKSANPGYADGYIHMIVDPTKRADPSECKGENATAGRSGDGGSGTTTTAAVSSTAAATSSSAAMVATTVTIAATTLARDTATAALATTLLAVATTLAPTVSSTTTLTSTTITTVTTVTTVTTTATPTTTTTTASSKTTWTATRTATTLTTTTTRSTSARTTTSTSSTTTIATTTPRRWPATTPTQTQSRFAADEAERVHGAADKSQSSSYATAVGILGAFVGVALLVAVLGAVWVKRTNNDNDKRLARGYGAAAAVAGWEGEDGAATMPITPSYGENGGPLYERESSL